MSFKEISIEAEGTTPLMMHKIGENTQKKMENRGGKRLTDIPTPEDEAEDGAYRTEKGELCVPARCLKACIVRASSFYKIGKKSMKPYIAGCVRIEPYEIGLGTKKYEIDKRPVVVNMGNRIIRSRPLIKEWKLKFKIVYNAEVFATKEHVESLKRVLEEAGMRCGLLDNRPEKGGENGTFKITKWVVSK